MAELRYWIWMNELGINPFWAHQVIRYFGDPQKVYFAEREQFERVPNLKARDIRALCNKNLDHVYKIQDNMQKLGGQILTHQDAMYPQRLRNIEDAPLVLYVRGKLPVLDDEAAVAIVGTRKCSAYGVAAATRIASEVVQHGGIVVTGLATGVDSAAAHGALWQEGIVIGVLGCGLDRVYPKDNHWLYEDVLANGALISEYPPGTAPLGYHFPRRNRIMSGLSVALVAAEIPHRRSGAMISVKRAVDQGREVFLVPANIDAGKSTYSNKLIDEGYQSASSGWRVLQDYVYQFPKLRPPEEVAAEMRARSYDAKPFGNVQKKMKELTVADNKANYAPAKAQTPPPPKAVDIEELDVTDDERAVLCALTQESIHIDEIISASNLHARTVNVCLTTLEIAGHIRQHAGKRYSLG